MLVAVLASSDSKTRRENSFVVVELAVEKQKETTGRNWRNTVNLSHQLLVVVVVAVVPWRLQCHRQQLQSQSGDLVWCWRAAWRC